MVHEPINTLKKVILITEVDFWRVGTGGRARSREMINLLDRSTDLTIFSLFHKTDSDDILLKRLKLKAKVHWAFDITFTTKAKNNHWLIDFIEEEKFDIVILRNWSNLHWVEGLPGYIKKMIDIDDVMSEIIESKITAGIDSTEQLSFSDEIKKYKLFDKILVIQYDHVQKFCEFIDAKKIIYASHPINTVRKIIKPEVKSIGYIASGWDANLDGFNWFIDNVWPLLLDTGIQLRVYGYICTLLTHVKIHNVTLCGSPIAIADAYKEIDLAINPVRYGSGIKIKTIEAMANGVPIVVSTEGGRGLLHLDQQSLLHAKNATDFADKIKSLMYNVELRKSIAENAIGYIKKCHSHEACFQQLINEINQSSNWGQENLNT